MSLKLGGPLALAFAIIVANDALAAETKRPNNLILFVVDGLRALSVTADSAPAMAAVREVGVNFKNPHSVFPTFTTANASAMATGHQLGDTGNYSNTFYVGRPTESAGGSVTPTVNSSRVRRELDQFFGGDYLSEGTVLKAARVRGFSTAVIGKGEAASIFDHTEQSGEQTILFDDATGSPAGISLSEEVKAALRAAGLPLITPPQGENAKIGDFKTPGTTVANVEQQTYFVEVATKVVLPIFKARNKPFVLVYWSRDPDGTQHAQGDSLNALTPGINGPTSRAAIRNADDNLRRLRQALDDLGLAASTNIVIAADHGFATVSKESATSPAAKASYPDVVPGFLPRGFLAIDIAKALDLPLFDPDNHNTRVGENTAPRAGNGVIGNGPEKPEAIVAANGGSDLIYIPSKNRGLISAILKALYEQDYVSGVFVDDALGSYAGALPLSAINLRGRAVTPRPSIVVNFRSFTTGCDEPAQAAARILGLGLHVLNASTERDFDVVFANLIQLRAGGLVIGTDAFFSSRLEQLAALSVRYAVPTVYHFREFAAAGGLISYGGSITDAFQEAGAYTGRILKGEKPADLPIQQVTKVELIINLKTAKALGLTFPLSLLGRADEVIE
jgi:hypothetical protein